MGVNGLSEPIEVHVIITRAKEAEMVSTQEQAAEATPEGKPSYVHSITTNLSEANKHGLDNLAYWRNGFRSSKVYILNQALAQYLAQYQESKRNIPFDEV
jgi:hypothetical protein